MDAFNLLILFAVLTVLLFLALLVLTFWFVARRTPLKLERTGAPALHPNPEHWWESEAVFNPAALYHGGRVHLLYRALGRDGISRIGYASSRDGVHFDERLPYPVYEPLYAYSSPQAARRFAPLSYSQTSYSSGGGWGGAEDPRMVVIENEVHVTFTAFDGWGFVRMALMSTAVKTFLEKQFMWSKPALMSPPGEMHKNWVLFPEKVGGKYAVLHSLSPEVAVEFLDDLNILHRDDFFIKSTFGGGRKDKWDNRMRGAGAPPLKTKDGWLVLYHANDEKELYKYKVGAMLLDLADPTKVLYRTDHPILEPDAWYENDWKPGIVYASGAVIKDGELFVYYGGGDKYVAIAKTNLEDFLYKLTHKQHATLTPVN